MAFAPAERPLMVYVTRPSGSDTPAGSVPGSCRGATAENVAPGVSSMLRPIHPPLSVGTAATVGSVAPSEPYGPRDSMASGMPSLLESAAEGSAVAQVGNSVVPPPAGVRVMVNPCRLVFPMTVTTCTAEPGVVAWSLRGNLPSGSAQLTLPKASSVPPVVGSPVTASHVRVTPPLVTRSAAVAAGAPAAGS